MKIQIGGKVSCNEDETARICGMAISPNRQQDHMVWIGNKNEEFFV